MRFGLTDETIAKINAVFAKYPEVEEVLIFGSRAKESHREGSDIDITLKGNELNDTIKTMIVSDIDELNTPYLFDISIFNKLNSSHLEDHIKRVGQVFFKKT
jgi:predicted nucleotidyltransferase